MTLSENKTKRLVKYIERWTRCGILSRYGRFDNLEFTTYAQKQLEYEDRIRKLLFGNPNAFELGVEWGLIKKDKNRKTKVTKKGRRNKL